MGSRGLGGIGQDRFVSPDGIDKSAVWRSWQTTQTVREELDPQIPEQFLREVLVIDRLRVQTWVCAKEKSACKTLGMRNTMMLVRWGRVVDGHRSSSKLVS